MALAGPAFLALWNDIAPHREREYDRWHTREHVPERVALSGFLGARRYVDRAADRHRYFTLYELADRALAHPDYVDVVQNPTPWSASMRGDFRNVVRAECRVTASQGEGLGAALAILCHEHAMAPGGVEAVEAMLEAPGVTGCHVGEGSAGAPSWLQTAEGAAPARAFDRILLVEALDRECASSALATAQRLLGLASLARDFGCGVYDLAFAFPGHDASSRDAHRRAHWRSA